MLMEDDDDNNNDNNDEYRLELNSDDLDQFKVDILSLEDGPASRIVLYNVNLPCRLWQDKSSLIWIRNLVTRNFQNVSGIYF